MRLILVSAIMTSFIVIGLSSCEPDVPALTQEELLAGRLTKTWRVDQSITSPVQVDGYDKVSDYEDFELNVTAQGNSLSYSVQNAQSPGPWPSNGTWSFVSEITDSSIDTFEVSRNDELIVHVTLTGIDKMKLEFSFANGHTGGRVTGVWVFYLVAK